MHIERKKDRSIYYWLVDLFSDAPFIKIVPENEEDELTLPRIAVTVSDVTGLSYELGNRHQALIRAWFIDIYAVNKDQRLDIAWRIMDALDNGIPILDFDEGFPPEVTPTQIGAIVVKEKSFTKIDVNPELVEKMYWRGSITILQDLTQVI